MRPDDAPAPADPPEQPDSAQPSWALPPPPLPPSSSPAPSLDASEHEALLQHLRRYQAHDGQRRPRGRTRLAASGLAAGAGLLIVIVGLARWSHAPTVTPEAAGPVVVAQPGEAGAPRGPRPEAPAVPATGPPAAPPERPAARPGAPAGHAVLPPDAAAQRPAIEAEAGATPDTRASVGARATPTAPPPSPPLAGSATPAVATVSYQPRERLRTVSAGDSKERVFDRFGTTFEQRNDSVVRIEGMRWRANGRSPHHAQVEVAEVTLADAGASHLYWFLFGDGRLIAWGRAEEWPAATRRHEIEIDYQPVASRRDRR